MAAFNLVNLSGLLLSLQGRPHRGLWPLFRSWLRPHRGISQGKLPDHLGFFQFMHNARRPPTRQSSARRPSHSSGGMTSAYHSGSGQERPTNVDDGRAAVL